MTAGQLAVLARLEQRLVAAGPAAEVELSHLRKMSPAEKELVAAREMGWAA